MTDVKKFEKWSNEFSERVGKDSSPLSVEVSQIFLVCNMMEMDKKPLPDDFINSFLFNVCKKRAEYLSLNMTDYTVLFLSCLCDSPGTVVMYLYYIKSVATKKNYDKVDMTVFTNIFPFGTPSKESLNELWDLQKVDGINLLDRIDVTEL